MHQNNYVSKAFCLFFLPFALPTLGMFNEKEHHESTLQKIQELKTVAEVDEAIDRMKDNIKKELLTELESITLLTREYLENTIDRNRSLLQEDLQKKHWLIIKKHDKKIPPHTYTMLNTMMVTEKIIPRNVRIDYKPQDPKEPGLQATAIDNFRYPFFLDKPVITIYEPLIQKNPDHQFFVGYHELLGHVFLTHSTIGVYALQYTSNIDDLKSIIEREANIHAASKHIIAARAGKEFICNSGHTNITDNQSHCQEMEIMYELMKQKQRLS